MHTLKRMRDQLATHINSSLKTKAANIVKQKLYFVYKCTYKSFSSVYGQKLELMVPAKK